VVKIGAGLEAESKAQFIGIAQPAPGLHLFVFGQKSVGLLGERSGH
jgi:hypothetical protein